MKDEFGNTFSDPSAIDFSIALRAALLLAVHWQVIDLDGAAILHNWRFEGNEPVGDPGLVTFEEDDRPHIALSGCSFGHGDLGVIDAVLAIITEARDD